MSLLRSAVSLTLPKSALRGPRCGLASSVTHKEDGEFPREDYSGTAWRNACITTILAVVAYKYAPEPGDRTYLTRWIAFYKTPRETWVEINARHTAQQQETSTHTILLSDAKKEAKHRYRYSQILDQSSPFLNGVGM